MFSTINSISKVVGIFFADSKNANCSFASIKMFLLSRLASDEKRTRYLKYLATLNKFVLPEPLTPKIILDFNNRPLYNPESTAKEFSKYLFFSCGLAIIENNCSL